LLAFDWLSCFEERKMKKLFFALFVCLLIQESHATTYYISNSGSTGNRGNSPASPWPFSKVNSFAFSPGDHILFHRGETFYGEIKVTKIGTAGNPITYSAYGTGAKPIITGFKKVSSWTNLGGNIWESTNAVSTLTDLKTVLINGVSTPMGRYPNGDASYPFLPNFFTFQAHTGTGPGASSITSNSLADGNDWTGADVVIRMNQWTFHREVITSQRGTSLNFSGVDGALENGWGFFIQNDIRTLNQQGEWYYNPSTKKLDIFSTTAPRNVQVSTIDTLFHFYSNVPTVASIHINNLQFQGANTNDVWISGNLVFSVTNCDISYAGYEGIMLYGGGIQSGIINNNAIHDNGSSAVFSTGTVSGLTITQNRINTSGIVSFIRPNWYNYGSIKISAPYSLIQYNTIDSSAYCGIEFRGEGVQVRNNFVNHSALVRGDAGGIYTGYANEPGKVIDGNIILNSEGNPRGTRSNDYFAFGIYIDDLGNHLSVTNNTVANCHTAGIYLHNSHNLTVRGNTIYNCGSLAGERMWANGGISMDANTSKVGSVHSNRFTENVIFAITPYQYALNYYSENGSKGDVSDFGIIDSNYYVKIASPSTLIRSRQTRINGNMSLQAWQSASATDLHSREWQKVISNAHSLLFVYNPNNHDSTISLPNVFIDVKGRSYNQGSITLPPYSSAVLIKQFKKPGN
jgi:parallel beta-helix repeat protein